MGIAKIDAPLPPTSTVRFLFFFQLDDTKHKDSQNLFRQPTRTLCILQATSHQRTTQQAKSQWVRHVLLRHTKVLSETC